MSPPATAQLERLSRKTVLGDLFEPTALAGHPDWRPFRPGIDILSLYGESEESAGGGPSAALLRYRAGASVPAHERAGYEHVAVLSGSQQDADGRYARGCLVISHPHSRHTVTSDEGCVVLVIWNRPVALLEPGSEAEPADGEVGL